MPLCARLLCVLPLALACSGPRASLPACAPGPVDLGGAEHRVLELVNRHRRALSLTPLAARPELARIAREHSREMSEPGSGLSHGGFRGRARRYERSAPVVSFAENIAATCMDGARAADDAFAGWLRSPPHRRAIEGNFRGTGVGAARDPAGPVVFTQLFAAP